MSNPRVIMMKEKEEDKEQKLNELEKFAKAHIKVVDKLPFDFAADDPFLVKKLEDAYKVLEEAPLPAWLVKRMDEKE